MAESASTALGLNKRNPIKLLIETHRLCYSIEIMVLAEKFTVGDEAAALFELEKPSCEYHHRLYTWRLVVGNNQLSVEHSHSKWRRLCNQYRTKHFAELTGASALCLFGKTGLQFINLVLDC